MDQVRACSAAKISISSSVQSISSNRMAQRACSYIWFIRTASYCSKKEHRPLMTFQIQIHDQQLICCWAEAVKAVSFLPPPLPCCTFPFLSCTSSCDCAQGRNGSLIQQKINQEPLPEAQGGIKTSLFVVVGLGLA